ncbi:MAG: hypothetical protein Q4G36_09620 [Paracoccus sp. (in: a-proteobacteria)]|nr:hypothetical protein [Paracoccus sp. (in: a-proteobacteria)]
MRTRFALSLAALIFVAGCACFDGQSTALEYAFTMAIGATVISPGVAFPLALGFVGLM